MSSLDRLPAILLCLTAEIVSGSKNVLLIIADDLRPSLGGYGDSSAYTPNIDDLIKDSFTFRQAYAQQALCAPSRNSFLTSRRPDTLHLYDFYSYWRSFSGNFTTLPQYFKDNLYETRSIGKVFHPGESSNFTDDYPFSWSYPPWHPSTEKYKDAPVCFSKNGWFKNIVCPVRLEEQPGETLPDIEIVEEARAFLYSRKKQSHVPFFLAVGFHKPHIPLKFPLRFLEYHPLENITLPKLTHYPPGLPEVAWNPWTDLRLRHDVFILNLTFPYEEIPVEFAKLIKQSYFASVTYIDTLIGKLLKTLTETEFHKNTIVVLIGDHGWSLGEHGEWSKYSNFDVALRVPLVIRVPNLSFAVTNHGNIDTKRNKIYNDIVELIDLFPTIVDLTGLPEIPHCKNYSRDMQLCTEGESLMPLMLERIGKDYEAENLVKSKRKNRALSQYPRPGLIPSLHPNSDKPRLKEIKIMGYSMRTDRFRYTEWIEWNSSTLKGNWDKVLEVELYDHSIDPGEDLNIANRPGLEKIQKILATQLRMGFLGEVNGYKH